MQIIKNLILTIRDNTEWLYTIIYQNKIFFIDYWSFIHFVNGFLLAVLITNYTTKNISIKLFLILALYEIVEISLYFISINFFKPEIIKDQITDIFIGLLGGMLRLSTIKQKKYSAQLHFAKLIIAFIMSFLWVGFYNYKYNINYLNNEGLNLWSFSLWFIGSNLILVLYDHLYKYFQNIFKTFLVLYFSYILLLLSLEFIGQEILSIHEVSKHNSKPLIFNLIHGNIFLHIFYLTAPITLVLTYNILRFFFERSFINIYNSQEIKSISKNIIFFRFKNFI